MSQYTELLNEQAETLSPDADDYEEKLLEIATLFRGFGAALTSFMEEHGYTEDADDVNAKVEFLREKFKSAGFKPPRDFEKLFSPDAKIKRTTAYKLCFAFGLDVPATNEFFRCVWLERGFDCHTISEAVYYFCIRNGLPYNEAQRIIGRLPKPEAKRILPNQNIHYTETIINDINGIDNPEDLIKYIIDNIGDFQYNNATAIKYIQELWWDISKPDGLAVQEGRLIDGYNLYEDRHQKGRADTRLRELIEKEVRYQREKVRPDDSVVAKDNASTWTILSQILGMTNEMESRFAKKHDRSLTEVLSKNALLPFKASYCFPSQHSIDKVLRGESGDNETMRKLLILLVFYAYWSKLIIKEKNEDYSVRRPDTDRCLETINNRLLSAGYPALYSGNPYDWLFMWSLNDEHPLRAFRTYMGEVFTIYAERSEDDH